MKTSDLIGHALDWAVAKCEKNWTFEPDGCDSYSTDWAIGGPIIEREEINLLYDQQDDLSVEWLAHIDDIYVRYGPTPLIAAMRCYVAFRLGDEVDIPLEFL